MKKKIFYDIFSYLNKKISTISFLLTLFICALILYITSIFELRDYSSTIGFSSQTFEYRLFADGQFYKDSLDFYQGWNFLSQIGKNFVAGPVVPFILSKLSFQSLPILFGLFSLFISSSVYFWVKIISVNLKSNFLKYFVISIIIFNPYNFYFVLKPGSEIPFQFFFSIFCFTFINCFKTFNSFASKESKNLNIFRISFYSCFLSLIILLLTRPTSLLIAYVLLFFLTILIILKPSKLSLIRNEIFVLDFILLSITIYCSSLYYQYAITSWSWLNSNPDTIAQYGGVSDMATYFGIPEVEIKSKLINYPFFRRYPLYLAWKFSSWILGICGIRDSFSIINSSNLSGSNLRIWQIIIRVTYGLIVYLPVLLGNLFFSIIGFLKIYLTKFKSSKKLPFLMISVISLAIIFPNMFFFNNERYIFMVFPPLLISFFSANENLLLSLKN